MDALIDLAVIEGEVFGKARWRVSSDCHNHRADLLELRQLIIRQLRKG